MGTYTITAVYNPTGSFTTSSAPTTFTVGPDATSVVSVPSDFNPVRGEAVTIYALIVTVNSPGSGTPTGTVTFKSGSTALATEPIVAVHRQPGLRALAGGSRSWGPGQLHLHGRLQRRRGRPAELVDDDLHRRPRRDDDHRPPSSPATPVRGQAVTLYALISANAPGVGSPTGVVAFDDGSTVLGFGTVTTINGQQWATLTTSSLAAGTHSIKAVYGGDGGDQVSISTPFTVTVGKDATTTAGVPSASSVAFGQAVTLFAVPSVVAPGAGTPTGSVNFVENGRTIGSGFLGTVNGLTYTFFTTSTLSVGTHTITAVYQGDASDLASTSAPFTVTVTGRQRPARRAGRR